MSALRDQQGMTVVKVMCVLVVVLIGIGYVLLFKTVLAGNFWYTEEGVLRELRLDNPEIEKILSTERLAWSHSVITVADSEGRRRIFTLDTNVLFNYTLQEIKRGR